MKKDKLTNVGRFDNIYDYVNDKINAFSKEEKTFSALFSYMFSEEGNVFAEITDGYRIKKITYGEQKRAILRRAEGLKSVLNLPYGSMVGIYANNSVEWIEIFWSVLALGYNPLLLNVRQHDSVIEKILSDYSVETVLSDGKTFSVKTITFDSIAYAENEINAEKWGNRVIFTSSGTTENVKLCAYTAENFYYQLENSVDVVEKCPKIASHYEGELKLLTLLPFYHVFGFIAVYMWFAFFSRTLVFLKDMNPQTILTTVKKHKVTHVFAVPLVWETIAKTAKRKIAQRGEKVQEKFEKALKLANSGALGKLITAKAMREVRENLVGDSVRFMISGGSAISDEALEFINGIGYHLANGYGMTEIGITSVERSDDKKILNSATVGAPFGYTEYSVNDKGILLVKGRTRAYKIIRGGVESITDFDQWFETGDLVSEKDGRYFIGGRVDDLIVGDSGENLNPTIAEAAISVEGIDRMCIFADGENRPVLLVSLPGCFSSEKIKSIYDQLLLKVKEEKLGGVIKKIVFTSEPLISGGEFKVSRTKIAKKYKNGEIRTFDPKNADQHIDVILSGIENEVRACFAEVLDREAESIGLNDDFFSDLNGNSMDYFLLLGTLKAKIGIEVPRDEANRYHTVKDFSDFVRSNS